MKVLRWQAIGIVGVLIVEFSPLEQRSLVGGTFLLAGWSSNSAEGT